MLGWGCGVQHVAAQAPVPPPAAGVQPLVLLREQSCEPARYASSALLPLLRIELAGLGLRLEPWPVADEAAQTRVLSTALALLSLRCTDSADGVELELDDLAAHTHSTRTLALGDVAPGARERALALALASSLELSLTAALRPQPLGAPASKLPPAVEAVLRARLQARLASPERPARAEPEPPTDTPGSGAFELTAMTRVFPSYSTGLLGLQAGAALPLDLALVLDVDAETLVGQSELSDAAGTVGTMWLYWLSAGLGLSLRSAGPVQLALGPRLRLGYALADAQTERAGASARDDHGALFALLAVASLRSPIGRNASLLFGVDFGYTLVGIVFVGDQARLSGMAGVTAGLRAGVAL